MLCSCFVLAICLAVGTTVANLTVFGTTVDGTEVRADAEAQARAWRLAASLSRTAAALNFYFFAFTSFLIVFCARDNKWRNWIMWSFISLIDIWSTEHLCQKKSYTTIHLRQCENLESSKDRCLRVQCRLNPQSFRLPHPLLYRCNCIFRCQPVSCWSLVLVQLTP